MITLDRPAEAPLVLEPPDLERAYRDLVPVAPELPAEVPIEEPEQPAEPARLASVVTVYSPKGGTGTTFVATNLAVALAARGGRRVCLVDLDLEFGDVAITTGLAPTRSIADAVGQTLDDDVLAALVTAHSAGLDCVLAPIDPAAAEQVSVAVVAALLRRLRERYEVLVVDTPSQLSEHVLEAFDLADHHVLVTTPAIAALKNLRLLLDTLDLLGTDPGAREIVVNQADERAGLRRAEIEEALRHPIALALPASADAAASVDEGTPLLARGRDDALGTALRAFAATTVVGEQAATARRGLRLGRISRKRSS